MYSQWGDITPREKKIGLEGRKKLLDITMVCGSQKGQDT